MDADRAAHGHPRSARRLRHLLRPQRPAGRPSCSRWRPAWRSPATSPATAATCCSPTTAARPRPLTLLVASGIDAIEAGRDVEYQWSNTDRTSPPRSPRAAAWAASRSPKDNTAPHADELTAGFRREIFPNRWPRWSTRTAKFSNIWAATENNRIWDPTGSRVIGWKDPARVGRDVTLYSTPDGNWRKYHGFTSVERRAALAKWVYNASYNLSWTYGPAQASWAATARATPARASSSPAFTPRTCATSCASTARPTSPTSSTWGRTSAIVPGRR